MSLPSTPHRGGKQRGMSSGSMSPFRSPRPPRSGAEPLKPEDATKTVKIKYQCGNYERDGPEINYGRLHQYSKRANRELNSKTDWTIHCQHWEQASLFDKILAWFADLDLANTPSIPANYHPKIDTDNEWVPDLTWQGLLLLDHSMDYLHIREPLDNLRIRRLIFDRLDKLDQYPIAPEEMHLAFQLLQFKKKWLIDSGVPEHYLLSPSPSPRLSRAVPAMRPRVFSSGSMASVSSSVVGDAPEFFGDWEKTNGALMRKIVRKMAYWHKEHSSAETFGEMVKAVKAAAKECEEHGVEPNDALISALEADYYRYTHPLY